MNENLNHKWGMLLAPAAQTNGATRTANLDTLGADYATIQVSLSSALNTNGVGPTISLKESDDTQATNFVTFNANATLTAHSIATAHEVVFHIDTRSRKRYLQLGISAATATNDTLTDSASFSLGRLGIVQPAASNMLASTNDSVVVC